MLARIGHLGLAVVLVLTACVSETETRKTGNFAFKPPPKKGGNGAASEPREAAPTGHKGVVTVPNDVLEELMDFVNRERVLIADRIEVDASRIPFQVAMVPMGNEKYVDTVELAVPEKRVSGILMRPKGERRAMVVSEFPRVRMGDGMELIAGLEIQVRLYTEVDPARPMFIRIQGVGNASYRDSKTGERVRRDSVILTAEVVDTPSGPEYRQRVN
jgi:hypothetical protein